MTTATDTARFVTNHSVLTLDVRHPHTAKALIDAHHMHTLVMSGFHGWIEPGHTDARSQMGILSTWSVDLKNGVLVLVVQSRLAPDWHRIPRQALTTPPQLLTVDQTFRTGEKYALRTVINPTRARPTNDSEQPKKRGKTVAHTTPTHVKRWMTQRLQPLGESPAGIGGTARIGADAAPDDLAVRMLPTLTSTSRPGLRIARAEIRGTVTVTDPTTLTRALTEGIGRGRAYSTGLLLLRSVD